MRDIKFRGWDGEVKRMWSWHELQNTHFCASLYSHNDGSWEVMQYTGLHGKSGKEIYEGDILKSTTGQIGRVNWRNDTLTYVVSWFAYSSPMGSYESYLYAVASSSTSIGNIYENPELLEMMK